MIKRLRTTGPPLLRARRRRARHPPGHHADARGAQAAGLVRSAADPTDGRKSVISVTPAGNRLFESAIASRDAWLLARSETRRPARTRRPREVDRAARAARRCVARAVRSPACSGPSSRSGPTNFRLFFIGQLISNTGNQLTNVALILFVLKLGHSGLAVGALAACQFGPLVALSAWAGAVADRSDKRVAGDAGPRDGSVHRARRARGSAPPPLPRCTRSPFGASCSPSTTRSGVRSCRRWCRRTTYRTRSCSTARSSRCRRSRVRRWRAPSSRPSASAGASRSTRSRTSR